MRALKVHKVDKDIYKHANKLFRIFTVCGITPNEIAGKWEKVTCKQCLKRKPRSVK